ncbi:MAG: ankyrin repeat domain-containing protein [Gammaproteobacteria bacterium]|nr:ankyrin repeat domain-containing protein [Gammaproteobacteria bacterium]
MMQGSKLVTTICQMLETNEALITAASAGNSDAARSLIAKGADVNFIDSYGWTALWHAMREAKPDVVKVLIESGANCNIYNKAGIPLIKMVCEQALRYKSDANCRECCKLLIEQFQANTWPALDLDAIKMIKHFYKEFGFEWSESSATVLAKRPRQDMMSDVSSEAKRSCTDQSTTDVSVRVDLSPVSFSIEESSVSISPLAAEAFKNGWMPEAIGAEVFLNKTKEAFSDKPKADELIDCTPFLNVFNNLENNGLRVVGVRFVSSRTYDAKAS